MLPARADDGRILGGVCAGISRAVAVDVTLIRLAFMILTFAWGLGLLLYVALWILMPDVGGQTASSLRGQLRQRADMMKHDVGDWGERIAAGWQKVGRDPWPRPLGRRWMALILLSLGALVLLTSIGAFDWITPLRAASLAMVLLGIGTLMTMRN
jgi:phage shock protein PspC (stress-responsive transcriptional regulator)